jgi:CRP-like cAMP-binding protein
VEDQPYVQMMDLLTEDQRFAFKALGTRVSYPAGQAIFLAGQPAHSVVIIQEGHVKVTRTSADGTEMILAIRGPDYIMGDEGVLMDEVRSASVTPITDVVGLDVKANALLDFVNEQQLWPAMYREAVRRRRQSEEEAILARLDDVKSRLARALLQLAAEVGDRVDGTWVIASSLSQQDLAGRIGASRDAVAAELRELRKLKLVTTARQRLVLHNLEALRKRALIDG